MALIYWVVTGHRGSPVLSLNCDRQQIVKFSGALQFVTGTVSDGIWAGWTCQGRWSLVFCMRPMLSYIGRGHARLTNNQFYSGRTGWSKPHTHSNPTNLALFGHKIILYRFNQGGGAHTIAGDSNRSRGAEPTPSPLTLTTAFPSDPPKVMQWARSCGHLQGRTAQRNRHTGLTYRQ